MSLKLIATASAQELKICAFSQYFIMFLAKKSDVYWVVSSTYLSREQTL